MGAVKLKQEVDVALAADVGSLQRLPPKTGNDSLLRELALTARNFDAEEAMALGLVSKVVQGGREAVLKVALETARVIAGSFSRCFRVPRNRWLIIQFSSLFGGE